MIAVRWTAITENNPIVDVLTSNDSIVDSDRSLTDATRGWAILVRPMCPSVGFFAVLLVVDAGFVIIRACLC